MHLCSTVLVSVLNLAPIPEDKSRTAASVRDVWEQTNLEEAWKSSSSREGQRVPASSSSRAKQYTERLEKDVIGKRREDGLFGQTILEEDDDSDEL